MKHTPQRSTVGGFTLIELMIVVAILGILSVVAIPAFVRYMRIAKTAEAYRMINKIVKGVQIYYETPHFAVDGSRLACMLAHGGSPHIVPDLGRCCSDGEPDGKCEPNETIWDTESWNAKLFKISDKHYYSYS